jgi:predicted metalloprotease with PDZ domain
LSFFRSLTRFTLPRLYGLTVLLAGSCLLSQAVLAAGEVRHTVSFPPGKEQVFHVRSVFPASAPVTELHMPNWTPGSYLIRDFAANVNRISAKSADGAPLSLLKTSKDSWQVDTSQTETLVVDYEVFTPEINVSTSWASRAFSLINGASVFLYTGQTRDLPQLLEVGSDASRGQVFSALPGIADGGGFRAASYDELVDNPVAIAQASVYRFSHGGQEYVLLNVGDSEFWDGALAAQDVEKVVAATQAFWGSNPLERPYWFMNFIVDGKGGLEHDQSTVIMTGRLQMRDRKAYIKWLGTVAHEFFHVWNVRHMRPLALERYDYQNEQYTRNLWLAEGLTSYYDNLLLSRAGLVTPDEYLDLLAKDIHTLETTPGRLLRPVTEASLDAWIRHYQPNANTLNSTISYYTKGAVIGFVLDTFIRKNSRDRRSLDEVMQKMYSVYSSTPYSGEAFEKAVVDIGGVEAGELLKKLTTTTADPDVDAALDWYGLELNRGAIVITGAPGEELLRSDLGVLWDTEKPGMIVSTVLDGSGGSAAGLMAGDEVLAIGGERLTRERLSSLMSSFRPGEKTSLTVSRRDKIISLEITLDTAVPENYSILPKPGFDRRDMARLQSLLGQDPGGRR